jgi:hypothetical protein
MTNKNELQSFEEEFFKKIREHDAWKKISGKSDFPWSEKIIERYADNWDWTELCQNQSIRWSEELIEKFKSRIDWDALSKSIINRCGRNSNPSFRDWDIVKKFESRWNWHLLSGSSENIPVEILEQFIDKWDWKELIDNRYINWSFELFEKFKRYIPVSDFDTLKRSGLWNDLVEIEQQIIVGKILNDR